MRKAGLIFMLAVWLSGGADCLAAEGGQGGILTVVAENDLLRGTDRHFTHGSRISYYSGEIGNERLRRVAELLPWFGGDHRGEAWRTNFALGQNIYTPADISVATLQPEERPYAGYLYLGLGLVRAQPGMIDSFELQLGVVGPAALGREVQTWWHRDVGDSSRPKGWYHQLRNEPTLNLFWDRQWRQLLSAGGESEPEADLIPHAGLALGNVDSHLASGLTLRLGRDLGNDNGPPRIRPSLPGAGYFRKSDGFGGYFFVGGEARLVGRNIFLDGNTFRASHEVDKKSLVLDAQYGLVLTYRVFKFAITNIIRSQEFAGQDVPDRFTAFSLSWQL